MPGTGGGDANGHALVRVPGVGDDEVVVAGAGHGAGGAGAVLGERVVGQRPEGAGAGGRRPALGGDAEAAGDRDEVEVGVGEVEHRSHHRAAGARGDVEPLAGLGPQRLEGVHRRPVGLEREHRTVGAGDGRARGQRQADADGAAGEGQPVGAGGAGAPEAGGVGLVADDGPLGEQRASTSTSRIAFIRSNETTMPPSPGWRRRSGPSPTPGGHRRARRVGGRQHGGDLGRRLREHDGAGRARHRAEPRRRRSRRPVRRRGCGRRERRRRGGNQIDLRHGRSLARRGYTSAATTPATVTTRTPPPSRRRNGLTPAPPRRPTSTRSRRWRRATPPCGPHRRARRAGGSPPPPRPRSAGRWAIGR